MAKTLIVTGSDGFIGRHLVENFRKHGHKVFALNRSDGDTRSSKTWDGYPQAECVVHLAGLTFVPDSWTHPELFIESNTLSTTYALEYCKKNGAKLIFPSSYMYSTDSASSVKETDALSPANPYALTKFLGEKLCRYYSEFYGTQVIILRPFNVYGIGQSEKFLIPSIVRQARFGDEIRVMDRKPSRDYLYIDDLLEAIHRSVDLITSFDVFNIGTGKSFSVEALIDTLGLVVGRDLKVISANSERPSEVNFTQADINHAIDVLKWEPQWSLFDGLSKIWNSHQTVEK